MPMVGDDGSGTMQLLLQISQMNANRHHDQIENILRTAHAGQTVKELGIDPSTFKRMFGNVPYDPNKQIKDESANDVIDRKVKDYIAGLDPEMAANLAASAIKNRSGLPGFTTARGLAGEITAGGIQGQIAGDVATATQPVVTSTAVTRANSDAIKAQTEAVQAGSGLGTAREVADRINAGINSMKKAPAEVQGALDQTLAFGKSASGISSDELANQLKTASLKEALRAAVNPNHPLNGFLAKNGLDIHSSMAATAMGMGSLLDNYAHGLMQLQVGNKEAQNILLRMSTDAAKQMSEVVFKGKLTPRQVLTLMDAQETGKPIPKGYEGAFALMQQATSANYQAAIVDALEKGDPVAIAAKQAIENFGKLGTNPRQLEAANEISRLATARIMTKLQTNMDEPDASTDPKVAAAWHQVYEHNLKQVVGAKVDVNWLTPNKYNVTGAPAGAGGAAGPAAGITTPIMPVTPVSGVPAISGLLGGADPTKPVPGGVPSPVPGTAGTLTPDQMKAVQDWMKLFGAQQAGVQAPSNPAPPVP